MKQTALALAAVTALAAPAAALADKGGVPNEHANENASSHNPNVTATTHGVGPAKGVAYVFKGTYAGDGVVAVVKGNAHARKADLVGLDLIFDMSDAKVSAADSNGDSVVNADDVLVGDKVVVKARLAKGEPGVGPYAAKRVVDQTHPADEEPVEPVEG